MIALVLIKENIENLDLSGLGLQKAMAEFLESMGAEHGTLNSAISAPDWYNSQWNVFE